MADRLLPCAACGCPVHTMPAGSGVRCTVCGWFDDFEQLVHPDLTYGANAGLTLRQAQAAAAQTDSVRGATRDPRWRPLRPDETPAADPNGLSSPVCYIATPDPAEYEPYWLRRD
jgi:hypothetical protein